MNHNTNIDDWYWVVFADTTTDDWTKKNKNIKETGHMKKFRSFIFPAKYYDQRVKTAEELLHDLKPNAKIIPFIDKQQRAFVYDRSFFADIECGDEFMELWDTIVKENPSIANEVMIKLFRAISQTALKIEYLSRKEWDQHNNIDEFFDEIFDDIWYGDSDIVWYSDKLLKKLWEMHVTDNWKQINMMTIYTKLENQFPDFSWYVKNICYHTFLRLHNNIELWPLVTLSKKSLN